MSLIMDLIGPELSKFAKIAESDFVYILASTNVDQLVPNMVTMYMTMSFWRVRLWVKSDSNIWSYLPLNKETLFNYTLALTKNNQSAPNLVKVYVIVRS